jgi:hypothetical protein
MLSQPLEEEQLGQEVSICSLELYYFMNICDVNDVNNEEITYMQQTFV